MQIGLGSRASGRPYVSLTDCPAGNNRGDTSIQVEDFDGRCTGIDLALFDSIEEKEKRNEDRDESLEQIIDRNESTEANHRLATAANRPSESL